MRLKHARAPADPERQRPADDLNRSSFAEYMARSI